MPLLFFVLYITIILIIIFMNFCVMSRNIYTRRDLTKVEGKKGRTLTVVFNSIMCGFIGIVNLKEAAIGTALLVFGFFLIMVYLKRKNIKLYFNDPVMLGFNDIEIRSTIRKLGYLSAIIAIIIFVRGTIFGY